MAGFMFFLGVTLEHLNDKHQHPERFSKICLTKGQNTKIATVLTPTSFKHHLVRKGQTLSPSLAEVKGLAVIAMIVQPFMRCFSRWDSLNTLQPFCNCFRVSTMPTF